MLSCAAYMANQLPCFQARLFGVDSGLRIAHSCRNILAIRMAELIIRHKTGGRVVLMPTCSFAYYITIQDRMEPLISLLLSDLEDNSNGSRSLAIPSFNFILPSQPNTPLPFSETSYLGSTGLLNESVSYELGLNDPIWSLDLTIDNTEQLEAVNGSYFLIEVSVPLLILPEIESLKQQLRGAIYQHAHKESKGFLPLDKLNEIVIKDSICVALRECMPNLLHDDV